MKGLRVLLLAALLAACGRKDEAPAAPPPPAVPVTDFTGLATTYLRDSQPLE